MAGVYLSWAMYHNGRYYFKISGTETVGERDQDALEDAGTVRSLSTGSVVLVSDSPEGPFEYLSEIGQDRINPGNKPIYWIGKWYSISPGTWDGQQGLDLAWSDDLFGTYTNTLITPSLPLKAFREQIQCFSIKMVYGVYFFHKPDKPLPAECNFFVWPLPISILVDIRSVKRRTGRSIICCKPDSAMSNLWWL